MNQKASDLGWIYHAPFKRKDAETPELPPASQIPGLSDLPPEVEEENRSGRGWIKDTDTKYIQLAKKGGREDLLRFREFKPKTKDPKGYPRVEWYYLEDNAVEDQDNEPQKPYKFELPEYMVHEPYNPTGEPVDNLGPYKPKRLPYAPGTDTVYEREGKQIKDHTVKLEEPKKLGYGVRAEKQKDKPVKYNVPKVERQKGPASQLERESEKPKMVPMPVQNEGERPSMGKILAFGYARDWEDSKQKWHEKQLKVKEQFEKKNPPEKVEVVKSTYQDGYTKCQDSATGDRSKDTKKGSKHSRKPESQNKTDAKNQSQSKRDENEQPELFKLSKFKNVQAKTSSHRPKEVAVVTN